MDAPPPVWRITGTRYEEVEGTERIEVKLSETWYGEGTVSRGKTSLFVHIGPGVTWDRDDGGPSPEVRLVFDMAVPEPGTMVITTERTWLTTKERVRHGGVAPPGPPEVVVDVTYAPRGTLGTWEGRQRGRWPCRVVKVKKRTLWERIR